MYDCVIPAAGASSRMGAWKPGLPFRGGTLLSRAVGIAREAGCRVLVVAGHRAGEIPRAVAGLQESAPAVLPPGVEVVLNPDWEDGMMGSLQAGIRKVSTPYFFVLPADMPFVPVRVFFELVREAEARAASGLPDRPVYPTFRGRSGHPVLIPASLVPESLDLSRDSPYRDFLRREGPVHLAVGDSGIRADLDTGPEYERALGSGGSPRGAGPD